MSEENKSTTSVGDKCCRGGRSKTAIIIVGLVLLTAIIITAILRDRIVNQQFKSVTVTGQGKVSYLPDLAIVTLGAQIDKVTKPAEALNQLNTKVAGIIKAVQALKISAGDIETQNYSLYPQYDYRNNISVVTGYNANEQLVVKVEGYDKDQNKLNRVIEAASNAGANQVNSLSFDSSQMNSLKQQARIMALVDAKAKSAALASAAGVQLSDISGWYENLISPADSSGGAVDAKNSAGSGMGGGGGGGGSSVTPQTPSGDQEVIIEIGLTYNLK